MDSSIMRDPAKRKAAMVQFPRKRKGKFEKQASGRAKRGKKYRKAFAKVKKNA